MKKLVLTFALIGSLCLSGAWAVMAEDAEESMLSSGSSVLSVPDEETLQGEEQPETEPLSSSESTNQDTVPETTDDNASSDSTAVDSDTSASQSGSGEELSEDPAVADSMEEPQVTEPAEEVYEEESDFADTSEEVFAEESTEMQIAEVVAVSQDGKIEVPLGTSLEEVLAKLPAYINADLADGQTIPLPVDWYCESIYDAETDGYYTFDSVLSPLVETEYSVGFSFAPGVTMPRVVVEVILSDEEKSLVMDDTTAAYIGPVAGEKAIFEYLVKDLKLNHAAACGVLANMYFESNFNSHAIGDGGTSYGLCQWHLGRYTSLVSFCEEKGLAYGSIKGQLRYLRYELENGYSGVLDYLRSVPNTAAGAFQAGYYWCFHYERPAYIFEQSNLRGNAAKNSYWPRFKDYKFRTSRRQRILENRLRAMEA